MSYLNAFLLFFVLGSLFAYLVTRKEENQSVVLATITGLSIFVAFPIKRILGNPGLLSDIAITFLFTAYFLTISSQWKMLRRKK
jgi:hypothetical protein